MLESVFFITLGISCVLLMMLIYHFKQRISKLESNNETMFEIINNMVQELSVIKTTIQPHVMPPQFSYPNNQYDKIDVNIDEDMPVPMLKQSTTIEESESEEGSDEETESEEGSDEQSESEEGSDEETESEKESDNETEGDSNETERDSDDKIKLINIDVTNIDESVDVENLSENNDDDDNEIVEINEIDNIQVNKLEDSEHLEEKEETESMINKKEVYKRMNVTALKALVVEKGLQSDPHKMKKAELIELLENN